MIYYSTGDGFVPGDVLDGWKKTMVYCGEGRRFLPEGELDGRVKTMIWRGKSLSRDRFTRSKQGSLTAVYGLWNSRVVRVNGCRR
jgi:hypothetical protein